jgi:carboxypeptidase family protein
MKTFNWTLAAAALACFAGAAPRASAQATTGTIAGVVTTDLGQSGEAAQVQAANLATGFKSGVTVRSDGRFTIPGLEVGNYTVTVRRIGFAPQSKPATVTLGQTTRIDFQLVSQAATLAAVNVQAEVAGAVISPSHTGAVTTISDSVLRRMPTLNRNFTDFVALVPQVSTTPSSGGLSGAGTNNRYNDIQIDGATETDVFGLGATGQPGGQANGKSIGIESVKEYQVLLSPYDVRQGNFAGVLINAVTMSGTNEFHGSILGNTRNQAFVRSQPYINDFNQSQYGIALGGPIVHDKVFFFVNPEFQNRSTPATGPYVGQPGLALTQARVDSFSTALAGFGYKPGDIGSGGLITNQNPLQNVFARLDFNLPHNTQLVIRDNYGHAENDQFSRSNSSFTLSSNDIKFKSTKQAPAAQLRTLFNNGSYNELLVGYTSIEDRRAPVSRLPQVTANTPGFGLVAGAERSSQGNELDQKIVEITDNYSIPIRDHRITIGTQNQLMKFRNLFTQNSFGVYTFGSIDSIRLGLPNNYLVGVPATGDGAVRFKSNNYSAYVEDEWTATPRLNLQYGLRADVAVFPSKPPTNPDILTGFNRNTADVPSGNLEWSPRLGFNYDVTGDARNQLRGGVGVFTGRPAYVWLSNAFQNSGLTGVNQLTCSNSKTVTRAPQFNTANIANPPSACLDGTTAKAGGEIDLLDPNLKQPQNLRATLGFDRRLGETWVATLEAIYTRGINSLYYSNIALAAVQDPSKIRGTSAAEGGRWIYGVGAAGSGSGTPDVLVPGRTQVYDVTNTGNDNSYQLTAGLQHRFSDAFEAAAYYTRSHAEDVYSLTSSTAASQWRFGRVTTFDENSREASRSVFEEPNRVVAYGTYTLKPTHTDLSVQYFGETGAPFSYTVNGDPNADGITQNDAIYIPKNASDPNEMTFTAATFGGTKYTADEEAAAFDKYISSIPCMNSQRGHLMAKNSCTNPFTNTVNVLVRQSLRTLGQQNVTLEFGIFNFLNLVNKNWGIQPSTFGGSQTLLTQSGLVGGSLLTGHPSYTFNPTFTEFLQNNIQSNYQMQLQLRYSF